jgi:tetratricopeptide (TPR) repeat protein
MSARSTWLAAAAVLALLVALAYSNSLDNGFHLDDVYGIEQNPAIRDLANVPSFFADPYTLTTRSLNADWRPLLQVTYALDYALGGLEPRAWRVTQLALHWVVCLGVFALGRALLGSGRVRDVASLSEREGDAIAAAAAALFAVHPIASGTANYTWARSTLLVAVFALPATVLWLRSLAPGASRAPWVGALLCFALALLVKAEALSIALVFGAAEVLIGRRLRWRALAPVALLCVVYLALRVAILPSELRAYHEAGPANRWEYLLTQSRVWWRYVALVLAPLGLVADDTAYPVSRSLAEPRVLLALTGWLAVLLVGARAARGAPALLAVCFALHLAPHSSLVPLAEMHNEHRPYLAATALFVLGAWGSWIGLRAAFARPRLPALALLALALCAYGLLTRERNRVWRDELSLWADAVDKTPFSARAQMNYGIELQKRGEFAAAEQRFAHAVELAPLYPYAHINFAIELRRRGAVDASNFHYDEAVRVAPSDPVGPTWRARVREQWGDVPGAIADWRRVLELEPNNAEARARLAVLSAP